MVTAKRFPSATKTVKSRAFSILTVIFARDWEGTGVSARQQGPAGASISTLFLWTPWRRMLSDTGLASLAASAEKSEEYGNTAAISPKTSLNDRLNVQNLPWTAATSSQRPIVVGHRGCLYDELENTLEGFQRAAQLGCNAVELDVFLLPKCGTLIVFHGGDTNETPGVVDDYVLDHKGSILEYTWEQVRTFRMNPQNPEFACPPEKVQHARIPTLEEVLKQIKEKTPELAVKIELKGPQTARPVLELVERMDMQHACEYSSFCLEQIRTVRELRPTYRTGALFEGSDPPSDFIAQALAVGASQIHLQYDACAAERIQAIHEAGMDSMVWFRGPIGMTEDCATKYNEESEGDMYNILLATGVRSMCVNRPDVLLDLLRQPSS